jgi:hypothetical protein
MWFLLITFYLALGGFMFKSIVGATLVLVFASGCTQGCGTCETIKKNDSMIERWINDVSKRFEGAKYNPGPPARVTFNPQSGGILAEAASWAGGVFSVNGRELVEKEISNHITCVADNSDGSVCLTCPKKPKIIFNCGQACGEGSADCADIADNCFDALLQAAVAGGYNPRTKNYSPEKVRAAMNRELAQNAACANLKGFHSKCEAAHTQACGVDATKDPVNEEAPDAGNPGTLESVRTGQLNILDIERLSTGY